MSRKHNTKHEERGTSNYPLRTRVFAIGHSRVMEGLETLRKRQGNRVKATCGLSHVHEDPRDCNGNPWFTGLAEEIDSLEDAA